MPRSRFKSHAVVLFLVYYAFGCQLAWAADWYTRYAAYPEYCSTPEQMKNRTIPMLQNNSVETELRHVTVVIRHGARTPKGKYPCWPGFWTTMDTAKWDCDFHTQMTVANPSSQVGPFWAEMRYDALSRASGWTNNILNGTCQEAQLTYKGYQQQLMNGQFLREAYLYDPEANATGDMRLRLAPYSIQEDEIFFRSDDESRTLSSGQVLLQSFLSRSDNHSTIPIHTADVLRDVLKDNEDVCPRLVKVEHDVYSSKSWKEYDDSQDGLKDWMREQFGHKLKRPHACLMAAICNDLTLPSVVDDFPNETGYFWRLNDYDVRKKIYLFHHDSAVYSKLSIGPLWSAIRQRLQLVMDGTSKVKLTLISGHDGTIAQLLSSLGKHVWQEDWWPPFAAMMILELHQVLEESKHYPSGYAFRLLYNGRVHTPTIKDCDEEVCDLKKLDKRLEDFATPNRDCHVKPKTPKPPKTTPSPTLPPVASMLQVEEVDPTMNTFVVMGVSLLSMMLGALAMWWQLQPTHDFDRVHSDDHGDSDNEDEDDD